MNPTLPNYDAGYNNSHINYGIGDWVELVPRDGNTLDRDRYGGWAGIVLEDRTGSYKFKSFPKGVVKAVTMYPGDRLERFHFYKELTYVGGIYNHWMIDLVRITCTQRVL